MDTTIKHAKNKKLKGSVVGTMKEFMDKTLKKLIDVGFKVKIYKTSLEKQKLHGLIDENHLHCKNKIYK